MDSKPSPLAAGASVSRHSRAQPHTSPSAATRTLTLLTWALALGLALRPARSARAEGGADFTSRRLDSQAIELMQKHAFREACPLFAESARLEPGSGVTMRLALCYELNGQLASAIDAYREAARLARANQQEAVGEVALRRARPLEERVPHLTFRAVHPAPRDTVFELDGVSLDPSAWQTTRPIDAGAHHFEARARGKRRFSLDFVIAPSAGNTIIAVGLENEADARPKRSLAPEAAPYWTSRRTAAVAAGGLGVLGLASGAVLGVSTIDTFREARANCSDGNRGCSQRALDLQSRAQTSATAADVALGAGLVSLGVGVLLWFTASDAPHLQSQHAAWSAVPALQRGSGCLLLTREW